MTAAAPAGLEGVIAAETVLSHVDGERGILLVRGRTLADLV
ncbi:MAG: citrate synthase/methylcitrate synthase, partial [Proteobacteria bacterium]|nr:citrate synthase/methylcitrate synthase [Pseudomonadota bacterium]